MPNHEKWSHPWTVHTSCLLMSKNSINWCLDAGKRKSEQKLIVLPCLHSPPHLFRCLLSRKISTQSHSAKFLNWGDHVNSVPDLAASPSCFKLTRRLFSSCNQPYIMSQTAIHYGYKSLGSFCLEPFKRLLYPNAITHTVVRGFTAECRSFKRTKLFSLLCF